MSLMLFVLRSEINSCKQLSFGLPSVMFLANAAKSAIKTLLPAKSAQFATF